MNAAAQSTPGADVSKKSYSPSCGHRLDLGHTRSTGWYWRPASRSDVTDRTRISHRPYCRSNREASHPVSPDISPVIFSTPSATTVLPPHLRPLPLCPRMHSCGAFTHISGSGEPTYSNSSARNSCQPRSSAAVSVSGTTGGTELGGFDTGALDGCTSGEGGAVVLGTTGPGIGWVGVGVGTLGGGTGSGSSGLLISTTGPRITGAGGGDPAVLVHRGTTSNVGTTAGTDA